MRHPAAAAVLVLCAGIPASLGAENQVKPAVRPPLEVGIGVERFFPNYGDWFTDNLRQPSANLRVTVPITPRFAFEVIGTLGRKGNEAYQRTEGLYFLQVKQRLRHDRGDPFQPFLTYGATGYYAQVTQRDVSIRQSDGSVQKYKGFQYTEFDEPLTTAFGGGFQQRLGSRVALRADAQILTFVWLPLGVRMSMSVSIPVGRYSTN